MNPVSEEAFLRIIQSRTARVAIGASAVRGRGHANVLVTARAFLRAMDLRLFAASNEHDFARWLDDTTERLRLALPKPARHWGLARKIINLFLLDCVYTTYLADAFDLEKIDSFLEIPLDSITGKKLIELGKGALDRWPGVKHLTPDVSAAFQHVALEQAKKHGMARVHLDALWWSVSRDDIAAM